MRRRRKIYAHQFPQGTEDVVGGKMRLLYGVSSDWNGKSNFRNKFHPQLDFIWFVGGEGELPNCNCPLSTYFFIPCACLRRDDPGWHYIEQHCEPVLGGLRKSVFAGEKQIIFLSMHPRHVIVNCPNIIFLGWRTNRDAQAPGIIKDQKLSLLCRGHFKMIPQVNLMTTNNANRPPTTISIFIYNYGEWHSLFLCVVCISISDVQFWCLSSS